MDITQLRKLIKHMQHQIVQERYSYLLDEPEAVNEETLEEGVYDPGILKAVFTAGGPGSGKSFTADIIFGVRDDREPYAKTFEKSSMVAGTGLKYVNSDLLFERGLAQAGISPSDLAEIAESDPDLWAMIQAHDDPKSIRNIAKEKLKKLRSFYEAGRLGMMVDGTGKDYNKVKKQKDQLELLGYDTYMVYVDTSKDIALARNKARKRKLKPEDVAAMWEMVNANKEAYAELFDKNIVFINNDELGPPEKDIVKSVQKFVNLPVGNPIGQVWIETELERRRGRSKSEEPQPAAAEEN